jgi:hypothetical protein
MSEAVPLDLDQMVLDRWTRRTGLIETAFESGLRGPPGRGGRTNCFARGRLLLEKLFAGPFVIDKARLKQDRVEIFRENFSTVEKEQGGRRQAYSVSYLGDLQGRACWVLSQGLELVVA